LTYLQESSESESESEEEESGSEEDSDEEESDWASDSESSSSSDSEAGAYAELKGRARWLKKNTVVKQKVVKNKEERGRLRAEAKAAAVEAAHLAEAATASKSVLPEANLNPSILNRKVKEIVASRGRRGTDNREVLKQLEGLSRLALQFGPRVEIPILMHLITAQFDLQRTLDDYMDIKNWQSCASYLNSIANVLDDGYKLGVEVVEETDLMIGSLEGKGKMKAAAKASDGAMAAVAADEKLINPETVSSLLSQRSRLPSVNCG
jgi:translation initiation factor 3 subunit C